MKTIIFAILFSVLIVVPSYAMTGNEWLAICKKESDHFDQGRCYGYLQGIRDANSLYISDSADVSFKIDGKSIKQVKYCLPKKVTLGQEKKIITKWLNEHPQHLHQRFDITYVVVVRETFPCDNQ